MITCSYSHVCPIPLFAGQLNNDAWQARTKALLVVAALAGLGPGTGGGAGGGHARWWGAAEGPGRAALGGLLSDAKVRASSALSNYLGPYLIPI